MDLMSRIVRDTAIMAGKPCIKGTRVTVSTILGLMAGGQTQAQIIEAYPYLKAEDLLAALAYAAWMLDERDLPLADAS